MTKLTTIAKQLEQLEDHLECVQDAGKRTPAEDWQHRFPNITPQEFYNGFATSIGNGAKPNIRIAMNLNGSNYIQVRMPAYTLKLNAFPKHIDLFDVNLPKGKQNQNTSTRLMHFLSKLAITTGRPHINLTACRVAGGYTWARFGFAPSVPNPKKTEANAECQDWDAVQYQLRHLRLNDDITRISYANTGTTDFYSNYETSPYAALHPKGFELTPTETRKIKTALTSNDPQQIWLLSDMGRELARIDCGPHKPPHIITVGKALLCGLSWDGHINLSPGTPAHDRFTAYINRAPAQTLTSTART